MFSAQLAWVAYATAEVETPVYFCHFRKGEKGVNAPVIIFGVTLRINRVLY